MKNKYKVIFSILLACSTLSLVAQTTTFNYTGSVQTYVVPPCVTSIIFDTYGAQGGGPAGGMGGRAQATIPVTPGATLYIYVGGQPTTRPGPGSGGYNGGGQILIMPCGGGTNDGWGGGGASDVRTISASLTSRIVVAGGGGGTGWSSGAGGAGGGLTGSNGAASWIAGTQGFGGTQTAGGLGGYYSGNGQSAPPGTLGVGGDANPVNTYCTGGGGGGGYYGGGGGYVSAGAGGSSYISYPGSTSTSTTSGVRNGNGVVMLTPVSGTPTPGPITGSTSICANASGNYSIASMVGATSYTWSVPVGSTITSGQGTTAISMTAGGTSGTISVTATFPCGTSSPSTLVLTVNPSPIVGVTVTPSPTVCIGSSVTLSGTGATTYSWSGGITNGVSFIPVATTTYTVTGTSAGCTGTATQLVTVSNPVLSFASQTNVSCNGGASGSASVNAATGGVGPYVYNWTPGNPTGDGTVSVTGLTAGIWTCTVTDASSCITTQTFNITQPSVLSTTSSATPILCNGGNSTVTVSASGGTAPYTGTGTFTVTAGTYSYTVTDANGCTSITSGTITQPSALLASSSSTSILCNGGSAIVTVVGSGGTPPYTGTGTFTVNAGTYSYPVTDANGCTNTTNITILQPSALIAGSSATSIACNGGTAIVTVTGGGGTSPYTGTGTFTVSAGTYSYNVTDANGCLSTTNITVTQPAVLSATATTVINPTMCGGTNGSIDITVSGGVSAYTFVWNNAALTEDISGLAAGAYTSTITDANGCTTTVSANLVDPNAPTVNLALVIDTVCQTTTAPFTLTGESPTGGTFSGPGVSAGMFDPMNANLGINMISYTYTDINGCTGSTVDSIWVDICMGISPISSLPTPFTIMPNPNNGTFMLHLNTTQVADVMIFDALGQLVSTQKIQPNVQQELTIANSGVYMITVITADGQRTSQRIVVSK